MDTGSSFNPGTAAAPTSTVEISISCRYVLSIHKKAHKENFIQIYHLILFNYFRSLLDKDILSKSDPMCVVYHKPRGSNHFVELLRTETIKDTLNPDFATKVDMQK